MWGSLQRSQPWKLGCCMAALAVSVKKLSTASWTPAWSVQQPGAAWGVTLSPLWASNRPSGKRLATQSGAESTYIWQITRSPCSRASSQRRLRFSKWYSPGRGSQWAHSTQVRTVLKPRDLIWARSLRHSDRDCGVMVESMGARAMPPLYQAETGRKSGVRWNPSWVKACTVNSKRNSSPVYFFSITHLLCGRRPAVRFILPGVAVPENFHGSAARFPASISSLQRSLDCPAPSPPALF